MKSIWNDRLLGKDEQLRNIENNQENIKAQLNNSIEYDNSMYVTPGRYGNDYSNYNENQQQMQPNRARRKSIKNSKQGYVQKSYNEDINDDNLDSVSYYSRSSKKDQIEITLTSRNSKSREKVQITLKPTKKENSFRTNNKKENSVCSTSKQGSSMYYEDNYE